MINLTSRRPDPQQTTTKMESPKNIKPCPRCGKLPPCDCRTRPIDLDHTYAEVAENRTVKSKNKPIAVGEATEKLKQVSLLDTTGRGKQPPRRTLSHTNSTRDRARKIMDKLEKTMMEASLEEQRKLKGTEEVGLPERPWSPTVPAFLDEHNRGNPRWCPLTDSTEFCLEWAEHPDDNTHPDHLY